MNVPSIDGSGAAFVFYGRPRVYTETEDISMDKVVYFIPETNPLTMQDISNNPSRDFLFGMLGAPQAKIYRKQKLVEDLLQNIDNRVSDTSFVSIPFHYGDGIRMKLAYHHHRGSFANKTIHPRTYIVTMFLSLESQINVGFTDISSRNTG